MPTTNFFTRTRLLLLALTLAAVLICSALYSKRDVTYAWSGDDRMAYITNGGALKDWMPNDVYTNVLNHIQYYLASKDDEGSKLTILGEPVLNSSGDLTFSFQTNTTPTQYSTLVNTTNYGGGTTSLGVYINEEGVDYAPVDKLYGVFFSGFDQLADSGLTGVQVYELQSSLAKFSDSGETVALGDYYQKSQSASGTVTRFSFSVGRETYIAQNTSKGLTDVSLLVTQSNKVVWRAKLDLGD